MAGYCEEGLRIKRIEAGRGATIGAIKNYVEDHTRDVEACHCIAKAMKKKKEKKKKKKVMIQGLVFRV